MIGALENLKLLKSDMIKHGWSIDAFNFEYKSVNYIVLVKLIEKKENAPKYSSVKLEFLLEKDFSKNLSVYANSVKLFIDAKTLHDFFGIESNPNFGNIFQQFYEILSRFIPDKIKPKSSLQNEAMCRSLSISDSEDPRKKYCFAVRRNSLKANGTPGKRSKFNDEKTRIRRESLYKLVDDPTVSFMYSMNPNDERSDEEILENWIKNKSK
ncbi:DUF6037 family protein [Enterococcus entomosocium]|uniref:DUF6037 family protein n=1 Tax=Enterococcus entomosocium TaxID=3034352 RepID=UPI003B5C452F